MPPYHRPVAPCDYGAGDYRYAAAFFQLQQQRIRIKGLIRKQRRKFFSLYQRCYLADVIPLDLPMGPILGPLFAPYPWR